MAIQAADDDKGYMVVISTAVSFAIVVFAIVGRFTSRWLVQKRLEANDYLIICAIFPKLGIDIASVLLVKYGIGQHIISLSLDDITSYLKVVYVGSFLYAPTIAFTKLSILSLYFVAFPSKFMTRSTIVLGGVIVAWAIGCCLVGLLACLPIDKFWHPELPGTCINTTHFYYGMQIPNIITDFFILTLPLKPVWDLQLGWAKSAQLTGALSIGIVTLIFDVVRLIVLLQLPVGGDFTYNQTAGSMWTDLEASVAILAACLPIMRPLLHPKAFWRERHVQESTFWTERRGQDPLTGDDGDISELGRKPSSSVFGESDSSYNFARRPKSRSAGYA